MPRPVVIAAVQMGPAEERKEVNAKRLRDLICMAADAGANIVCFPEFALTPYFAVRPQRDFEKYFDRLSDGFFAEVASLARRQRVGLVLGFAEESAGHYYNAALVIHPDGRPLGTYRKVHIPASFPAEGGELSSHEKLYFRPGDLEFPVFDLGVARVGVQICYDRNFPEGFRALALDGAEIIFVPSNLARYGTDWIPETWELVLRVRAFENCAFVVGVNRLGREGHLEFFGGTLVVSPLGGRVIARARGAGDELVVATLDLDETQEARRRLPFLRDRCPWQYGRLVR